MSEQAWPEPGPGGTYIGIEEAAPRGQITLRCALPGLPLAPLFGVDCPGVWQVAQAGTRMAVWMAPDELLLMASPDETAGLIEALEDGIGGHRMVLDVSHARAVFRLTGAHVGEVLAKGAPVDLSDPAFPPGQARRTHLAGIAVGIWRLDTELWEVVAFRSAAHHLYGWLLQAAVTGSEVHETAP